MVSMDIYGGFHSHGGTPNGWFIMEQPIKMDDNWGTPISGHLHIYLYDMNGIDHQKRPGIPDFDSTP